MRSIEIIKTEKTTRFLLYSVSFAMLFDVLITIYELTFIQGIRERNPIAIYLIQELGVFPGMIISVIAEIVIFASFFVLLKLLPLEIHQNGKETHVIVILANWLWLVFLLFAFISHFKAIINNLLNLIISI